MELGPVLFAVRHYTQSSSVIRNPVVVYPEFQAVLMSTKLSETYELIEEDQIKCHALRRSWTKTTYLFRPLDRVSAFTFYFRVKKN